MIATFAARLARPLPWGCAVVLAVAVIASLGVLHEGRPVPVEVLLAGAPIGMLSGLVAVGVVLVHRLQRLVNFAGAALGAPAGGLAVALLTGRGVPWPLALLACVAVAVPSGLLAEIVVRRFADAPRAVAAVVTVGVAQVLIGLELLLTSWAGTGDALTAAVTTPFSGQAWQVGIARFTGDHLVAAGAALAGLAGLALLLRRTALGLTVRAAAGRPQRARSFGLSVGATAQLVWCIAAVLAALALFLRAPLLGPATGGLAGPTLVLPALIAAAAARFEHLGRAFGAATLLSCLQSAAVFASGRANGATVALLAAATVAAISMGPVRGRGRQAAEALWSANVDPAPLPAALARTSVVRRARAGGIALAGVALLVAPTVLGPGDVGRLTLAALFGLIALSAVVATGWAGQLALGSVGVAAAGAAVAGGLATRHDGLAGDFLTALAAAAIVGAVLGVLTALPALWRPGVLPGVTTLAFAAAMAGLLRDPAAGAWLPAPGALVARPVLFGRIDLTSAAAFYYACLLVVGLGLAAAAAFRGSRPYRLAVAARDNRPFLQSVGARPERAVAFSLACSGALAGLAGGMLAYHQGSIDASTFDPGRSVDVLALVVAGGVGSLAGALLAATVVVGLPLLFPGVPALAALASGAGLLLALLLLPGGVAQGVARLQLAAGDRWARRVGLELAPAAAQADTARWPRPAVPALDTAVPDGHVLLEVRRG